MFEVKIYNSRHFKLVEGFVPKYPLPSKQCSSRGLVYSMGLRSQHHQVKKLTWLRS